MKKIDISPLLIAELCLLAYCLRPEVFFPFLLAASLHEAAHILFCKLFHVKLLSFSLTALGAALKANFRSIRQEFICIIAGPAVNLLCVLLFSRFPNFALFSLLLGTFNLLPLQSLDGGRLLNLLLLFRCSFETAEKICNIVEISVCILLSLCSILLCCRFHAGLWSIAACGLLLARSQALENILLFLPQRRKIKKKPREGAL